MKFYVYIIFSRGLNRFCVGQTINVENRLEAHNSGKSQYTSGGIPWILLWFTTKSNLSEAQKLEQKIKNLSQERKIRFMQKYELYIQVTDLMNVIT